MCSGLRPEVVCSIRVFMLVDMFMLCSVQLARTSVRCRGQGPSQSGLRSDAGGKAPVSPDFGPMQGTRSQLVRTSVRCRGQGPSQFPDFGPMQGARPQLVRTSVRCSGQGPVCALYVIVWYVVDWGSSLSFVLTVFSFGFRYSVFKRGARRGCSAHTIVSQPGNV